jgi:hypothetical protein
MTEREIAHELLTIARLLTRSKGDRDDNVGQATVRIGSLAARVLGAKECTQKEGRGTTRPRLMSFEASRRISVRLAAGPVPRTDLAAEALREGFTAGAIVRAMEELGVLVSLGPDGELVAALPPRRLDHDAKKNGSPVKS